MDRRLKRPQASGLVKVWPADANRTVAALYLAVLAVLLTSLGRVNAVERDPWSIGDWLINYRAGFVRRGLPGEVAFRLQHLLHISPVYIVLGLQLLLYGVLLFSLWRLLNLSSWSFWIKAFLVSPATLAFPVLDSLGGFRKEELLLAGFALLLRLLHSPAARERWLVPYVTAMAVLLALSHEALLLYLPYWFAAIVISLHSLRGAAKAVWPGALLGVVCLFAAVTHAGDAAAARGICTSLGADAGQLCSGAIASLAQNRSEAHAEVHLLIAMYHPVATYTGLALLALLPSVLAVCSMWRMSHMRWDLCVAGAGALLSMAATTVLFVYAVDWGRWIYIHTFSLFLLLLFIDVEAGTHVRRVRMTVRPWVYALLLLYMTTWSLPRVPGSLPQPVDYREWMEPHDESALRAIQARAVQLAGTR